MNLIQVFLQPIAYMVEMKEQLEITDLKGNKIGLMNVSGVHLLNFSCDLFIFSDRGRPLQQEGQGVHGEG